VAWLEGLPEHSAAGVFVLANRTIIDAFTARVVTLTTPEPSPLEPEKLPKHVRYRCATP